jgi:methyl-accepting chemotaxis protein
MSNEAEPKLNQTRPPFYRRQYIVDRPFQYRLIGTLMAIWLANSLFFTTVLYFFYEGHLREFYDLVPRAGTRPLFTPGALFVLAIGFIVVFGFVVLSIIALYMSNQIAGPLWRTKKCLDRVGRGEWSFDLRFRHNDFLRDIPAIFNTMLDGLKQQVEADLEELRAIEAAAKNPTELKRLVRKQRERKEAQIGLGNPVEGGPDPGRDPEPVSLSVH